MAIVCAARAESCDFGRAENDTTAFWLSILLHITSHYDFSHAENARAPLANGLWPIASAAALRLRASHVCF